MSQRVKPQNRILANGYRICHQNEALAWEKARPHSSHGKNPPQEEKRKREDRREEGREGGSEEGKEGGSEGRK